MKKMLIPLIPLLLATGCLKKETFHTIYLNPSGSLTWNVLEENVRGDEPGSVEERQVLADVKRGAYPMTLGLLAAGAARAETRLLRAERPFLVLTEGRFHSVERLAREVFEVLCDESEVRLTAGPDGRRLELECLPAEEPWMDEDDPRWWLLDSDGDFEIRLTHGRFVEAAGFEIIDDGEAVRLLQDEEDEEDEDEQSVEEPRERLRWSLTWTAQR